MDIVLRELHTEAAKTCNCACSTVSLVILNTQIDIRTCWFIVPPKAVGGPFQTKAEFNKIEKDKKPYIIRSPQVNVKQELINSSIGLILLYARAQHALARLVGENFRNESFSFLPSYDLFELLMFKKKQMPETELARQLLDFWNIRVQISPSVAAELINLRPDLGSGLSVLLSGIHCMLDSQRQERALGSSTTSISQVFFSPNWEKKYFQTRFSILACNPSAAKSLASKEKLTNVEILTLAVLCVVIYPLETIAKSACEFAGISLKTPEIISSLSKNEESDHHPDVDAIWAGASIESLSAGLQKGKYKPNLHLTVSGVGRPLFFFANNRYVAQAMIKGGLNDFMDLRDDQNRKATDVIRSPEVLELLCELGGDEAVLKDIATNSADGGVAALHAAVRDGNLSLIETLISTGGVSPDALIGHLPAAAVAKDVATLTLLDRLGANLSDKYAPEGLSLLHLAARMDWDVSRMQALIDLTANSSSPLTIEIRSEKNGSTPLMMTRSVSGVLNCLALGANPNSKDNEGVPVLSCLLSAGVDAMEAIPHLVAPDATNEEIASFLNVADDDGKVPLLFCQNAKAVKALILAGADTNIRFGPLDMPIASYYAYHSMHECLAEFLRSSIESNPDAANARDKSGKTPLMYVQTPVATQILIVCGADVNARCNDGMSVAMYLLMTGVDETCLVALAATGRLQMVKPKDALWGLTEATVCSTASAVAFVNRLGGDLMAKTLSGCAALHSAAAAGCSMAVKQIIETLTGSIYKKTEETATKMTKEGVVAIKLKSDDVVNDPQDWRCNSLLLVDYAPLVKLFCPIDSWKDSVWMFSQLPTHAAVNGMTPLMWCRKGLDAAILVAAGANIEAKTAESTKMTALHFAAARGEVDVIKELLRTKLIDLNVKDARQWTPLDYAAIMMRTDACALLSKMGAKANFAGSLLVEKKD